MPSDPSTEVVTSRMFFCGVMLMCINERQECEVGIIEDDPHHRPTLRIDTFLKNVKIQEGLPFPITRDLFIKVVKPVTPGVRLFLDPGGDHDFGLVPDLEGPKLHGVLANVNTSLLAARLRITDGLLYTDKPTPKLYDLIEWTNWDPQGQVVLPTPYGKLAMKVAMNIDFQDRVEITDGTTLIATMQKATDLRYEIHVENDCDGVPSVPVGSDFRLYYDVISPADGRKLDFRENGIGPFPEACEEAYLSQTHSLGLP